MMRRLVVTAFSAVVLAVALVCLVSGCGGATPAGGPVTSASADTQAAMAPADRRVEFSEAIALEILDPSVAFSRAESVVVAEVVEELPLRRNPLADPNPAEGPDDPMAPLPVIYKGYVLKVQRVLGGKPVPEVVTMFCMGSGRREENGEVVEVVVDTGLSLALGDTVVAPLYKFPRFGTPLGENEYWLVHEVVIFRLDEKGEAKRVLACGAGENIGASDIYTVESLSSVAESVTATALREVPPLPQ